MVELFSEESFEETPLPNAFVPSSHFCKDYESVCGRSCVELDEALYKKTFERCVCFILIQFIKIKLKSRG